MYLTEAAIAVIVSTLSSPFFVPVTVVLICMLIGFILGHINLRHRAAQYSHALIVAQTQLERAIEDKRDLSFALHSVAERRFDIFIKHRDCDCDYEDDNDDDYGDDSGE